MIFNGNAGHRGYRVPLAAALRRHGLQVLLTDYRGYGGNPGAPSEEGLAADARAARAYLLTRPDVDPARIVYFGESLGAAVAVRLAVEHPPAALILRSPFASLADVGRHHYPLLPVRLLLRDRFASIDRANQIRSPVLVIAGTRDSIVPIDHTRRLYDAIVTPKTLVEVAADHNDEELLDGEDDDSVDRPLHGTSAVMGVGLSQPGEHGELPLDFQEWRRGLTYTVRPELLRPIPPRREMRVNVTVRHVAPRSAPRPSFADMYERATTTMEARIGEL